MTAARAMRFAAARVTIVIAIALLAAADDRILAAEPIEIFDAHLHYNWEPQPYYRLDEVLALLGGLWRHHGWLPGMAEATAAESGRTNRSRQRAVIVRR